ncbi:hypothetical protein MH215_18895 [Paenibacillus sp. ACRSA]|uniref:hypothetical protein n=1 Tax=Paenibacillus sp. ACRSA TaxID=2918211 RepID=UPI001EF5C591|nr:hypothetical protein [Paenibacillus sp. ACRSA]MCG7379085.1 hypothetical protein [Paenibacillus sp. ACRSA]
MKETKQEKWERQIKKGKLHYIIIHGVIGWGIPTALIFTLIKVLFNDRPFALNNEFYKGLFINLVIFSLGGIWFGLWTWRAIKTRNNEQK